jgi:hypothetical protein
MFTLASWASSRWGPAGSLAAGVGVAGFGRRNSRPRSHRRQPFELKTPAAGHSKRTDFGASQTYPTPLQENPLDPYRTQFCPVVLIVAQHRLAESRGATQVAATMHED